MPEKPARPAKPAKTAKPAKPAKAPKAAKTVKTVTASPKRTRGRRECSHEEIAERAYFIHVEESEGDELADWLRAERELTSGRGGRTPAANNN